MVLDAAPIPGMTEIRQVDGEPLPCPGHDHQIPQHGSGRPSGDTCAAEPGDQNQGSGQPVTGFPTKKAAFLSRYRAHPEYGNRSAAGRVAAELAPLAGLQAGTGRTYIAEELRRLTSWRPGTRPRRTMTSPQAEPSAQALGESLAALAVQVAALRGQIALINQRLDRAGLHGDVNFGALFEELAETVADALDAAAPRGPAAPCWIGLDRQAYAAQLAELRRWTDTVMRQHYAGYELRDCWRVQPSSGCSTSVAAIRSTGQARDCGLQSTERVDQASTAVGAGAAAQPDHDAGGARPQRSVDELADPATVRLDGGVARWAGRRARPARRPAHIRRRRCPRRRRAPSRR